MTHAPAHAHDIRKEVHRYLLVFVALLVGTLVTVALYYVHFDSVAATISIALFIATLKASLVAGFFMHLISERKAIYIILLATVAYFGGMMVMTVWHRDETPRGTEFWEGRNAPAHAVPANQGR
jgi:cytochrome c oxidase subunit 4